MSPLWEVAATTGMGGGGGGAALVLFGHRKYAIKPTRIRTHSDSHTQRRREGLVFPGRAPWAGAAGRIPPVHARLQRHGHDHSSVRQARDLPREWSTRGRWSGT